MSTVNPIPPAPKDGYFGVLTEAQTKTISEFRAAVTAKDSTLKQGDDHEACRFLRSEKWDVHKSTTKYINYLIWRRDHKIDTFINAPLEREQFWHKLIPHAYHGYDKAGRPIYIEKSGMVNAAALLKLTDPEEAYLAHAWGQEFLAQRAAASGAKLGRHIETYTTILDLKGVNSSHRKVLNFTIRFATGDQNLYPERMGSVFIINAPWIFPVLWNIVKPFLDAVTRSKVNVVKGDVNSYLLNYIDADQLPCEYGGTCKACSTTPDCIEVQDISDLYADLKKEEDAMSLEKKTIPAGKKFEHRVEANAAGALFGWYFTVNGKDIGFSVEWIPKGKEEEYKNKKSSDRHWASPYTRHHSEEQAVQGEFTTTEPCIVIFTWDNSYSYWSSKEISYSVTEAVIDADTDDKSPKVSEIISSPDKSMETDEKHGSSKPTTTDDDSDDEQAHISFHGE